MINFAQYPRFLLFFFTWHFYCMIMHLYITHDDRDNNNGYASFPDVSARQDPSIGWASRAGISDSEGPSNMRYQKEFQQHGQRGPL